MIDHSLFNEYLLCARQGATKMSKAQDLQSCIRAWQTAKYNTLQKGQWWKCAQVLLMHKENLEQAVTTTGRRGEIYLKMDMGGLQKKMWREENQFLKGLIIKKQTKSNHFLKMKVHHRKCYLWNLPRSVFKHKLIWLRRL